VRLDRRIPADGQPHGERLIGHRGNGRRRNAFGEEAHARPEPSEKSMELATIACCSLASPPKAMDSTTSPCLAQIPFSVPISSGAKAKVVAEALPTRMKVGGGRDAHARGHDREHKPGQRANVSPEHRHRRHPQFAVQPDPLNSRYRRISI
jgi:hypothetical protein